jgi:hypothetical protein
MWRFAANDAKRMEVNARSLGPSKTWGTIPRLSSDGEEFSVYFVTGDFAEGADRADFAGALPQAPSTSPLH